MHAVYTTSLREVLVAIRTSNGPNRTPLASQLEMLLAGSVNAHVEDVLPVMTSHNIPSRGWPELQELARRFHNHTQTLTPEVLRMIHALPLAPCMRVAHQPNVLPSLGILSQIVALRQCGSLLTQIAPCSPSEVYLYIDYDVADDARFRTAHFPDVFSKSGTIPLVGGVRKEWSHRVMYSVPAPSNDVIDRWTLQIKTSMSAMMRAASTVVESGLRYSEVLERLDHIRAILLRCRETSSTLTDFNASFLSAICNTEWHYPTVFLRGSLVHRALSQDLSELLNVTDSITSYWNEGIRFFQAHGIAMQARVYDQGDSLLWWICPKCLTRAVLLRSQMPDAEYHAECRSCSMSVRASRAGIIETLHNEPGRIAPRVVLDDLLDFAGLRMVGGSTYIGGIEHRALSDYAAVRLGISRPHDLIWSPTVISNGPAETLAQSPLGNLIIKESYAEALRLVTTGRATSIYYMLIFGIDGLRERLKAALTNQSVDAPLPMFLPGGAFNSNHNSRDSKGFSEQQARDTTHRRSYRPHSNH